jgi:hypothetical protein
LRDFALLVTNRRKKAKSLKPFVWCDVAAKMFQERKRKDIEGILERKEREVLC